MKTIPLTDNEIGHIKDLYSQELERLQKRAHEISTILKKLRGNAEVEITGGKVDKKIDKSPVHPAKAGKRKYAKQNAVTPATVAEKKEKTVEQKPKGKRGRPAKIKTDVKATAKTEAKTETKVIKKRGRKPGKVAKPAKATKASKAVKATKTVKKAKAVKAVKPIKAVKAKKTAKTAKAVKPAKAVKAKKAKKPAKAVKAKKPAKAVKVKKTTKAVKAVKSKKVVAKPAVAKGKRGRKKSENSKKASWTTTIVELLQDQNKLLSSKAIVEEVMKRQNIPAGEYSKTRSIIAGSLSDLVLETKRLKTVPIPGQKGNMYGLSQWFDNSGNLLEKNKME